MRSAAEDPSLAGTHGTPHLRFRRLLRTTRYMITPRLASPERYTDSPARSLSHPLSAMSSSAAPTGRNTAEPNGKTVAPAMSYIPAAALKRFADDLENDQSSNKFLEINRDRVQHFIEKSPIRPSAQTNSANRKTTVPGINNYSFVTPGVKTSSFMHLQNHPEFQPSLGARSRFGDGDGSFFDRWLTCDVSSSKQVLDKDGFPSMRFSSNDVQTGFKKHIKDFKEESSKPYRPFYVKSYSQRRAERLEREQSAAEIFSNTAPAADDESVASANSHASRYAKHSLQVDISEDMSSSVASPLRSAESVFSHNDEKFPPVLTPITAVEKENYFGEEARTMFFDYFHNLSRQRMNTDLNANSTLRSPRLHTGGDDAHSPRMESLRDIRTDKQSDQMFAPKSPIFAEGDLYHKDKTDTAGTADLSYSTMRAGMQTISDEEKELLLAHLFSLSRDRSSSVEVGESRNSQIKQRPNSARTVFLQGCVQRGIVPHPSLIIRKELTSRLNLSSLGFGNEVAQVLAQALDLLPALESLSIADNNLQDAGLAPIVAKLALCPSLTSFDVSNNKVDGITATTLREYLSTPSCRLKELIMENANVDDYEAVKFMDALSVHNSLTSLNLSHNLLGSHEMAMKRNKQTAGQAIGELLKSDRCPLRMLRLSWNMIRLQSAAKLAESIRFNKSLILLDLSFNKLDTENAEILGDGLHEHPSLQTLRLASNNIHSKGAFVILSGVRSCETLTEVDLSENPIGEEGARSLLSLNIAYGHRVRVDIRNCSLTAKDTSCWFDSTNPRGEYDLDMAVPYERAICMELLRIAARDKDLVISTFKLTDATGCTADIELDIFEDDLIAKKLQQQSPILKQTSMDFSDPLAGSESKKYPIWTRSNSMHSSSVDNRRSNDGARDLVPEIRSEEEESGDHITDDRLSVHSPGGSSRPVSQPRTTPSASRRYSVTALATLPPQSAVEAKEHNDMQMIREMFRTAASRIFSLYDTDESHSLDRFELVKILEQLGLEGAWALTDKLLAIYDTDESGSIEEEEFVSFMLDVKQSFEKENRVVMVHRYHYQKGLSNVPKVGSPSNRPRPFIAPPQGKVTLIIDGTRTADDFAVVISTEQIQQLLDAGRSVCESSALFEFALEATTWTINEARMFFKAMVREIGSVLQVVLKLLPRMATPLDARMLIAYVTNHDYQQIQHLKLLLGPMFRIVIGVPNGCYQLFLHEPNDRKAIIRLFELSNTFHAHHKSSGLKADTSQRGDGSCFRNTVLDGKEIQITQEFLDDLPEKGRLEFDFVCSESLSSRDNDVISNMRLCRLLQALGVIEPAKRNRIFAKLQAAQSESKPNTSSTAKSSGAANRSWELSSVASGACFEHLETFYDGFFVKRSTRPYIIATTNEEDTLLALHQEQRSKGGQSTLLQSPTARTTRLASTQDFSQAKISTKGKVTYAEESSNNLTAMGGAGSAANGGIQTKLAHTRPASVGNELRTIDVYGQHVRELQQRGQSAPEELAARIVDALEMILAGRFLSCLQLALIIEKLPGGTVQLHDLATFRVELIVSLYSRITDVANFDIILKELEVVEIAMLAFRLGWLNIWNPMKMDGNYCFNLNRREERQMVKVLLALNLLEAKENWVSSNYFDSVERYRRAMKGELTERSTGSPRVWALTPSWFSEQTLPTKGVVTVSYSSKRPSTAAAAPSASRFNESLRTHLMSVFTAKPTGCSIHQQQTEFNVAHLEAILKKAGCDFSWN